MPADDMSVHSDESPSAVRAYTDSEKRNSNTQLIGECV